LPVVPSERSEDLRQGAHRLTAVVAAETIRSTPGLAKLLAKDPSIPFVSCSAGGGGLIAVCQQLNPSVLIAETSFIAQIDVAALTGNDGSSRSIKLLAIVDQDDPALNKRLLRLGCSGSVQRTAPQAVYRRALRALANGELWASRSTLATLVRELLLDNQPKTLTERQKEILALIATGYENRHIADALFVSLETVRWHIRTIYKKLGVRTRNQAIARAAAQDFAPAKPVQKANVPGTPIQGRGAGGG
jgi:DNA-binding NarL/FixJ family response regulator